MKTSWVIGIVFLFVLLSVISGLTESSYTGDGVTSRIERLMSPDFPETTGFIGTVIGAFGFGWDYISNLWSMLWFDYAQFVGGWSILRYLFMAVSVGMIFSIIMAIRGVGSS